MARTSKKTTQAAAEATDTQKAVEVQASIEESGVTTTSEAAESTNNLIPPQLNISDLQMVSKIIDLASQRGAFRAAELAQVGDTYNKLASFLAYIQESQAKAAAAHQEKQGETA